MRCARMPFQSSFYALTSCMGCGEARRDACCGNVTADWQHRSLRECAAVVARTRPRAGMIKVLSTTSRLLRQAKQASAGCNKLSSAARRCSESTSSNVSDSVRRMLRSPTHCARPVSVMAERAALLSKLRSSPCVVSLSRTLSCIMMHKRWFARSLSCTAAAN